MSITIIQNSSHTEFVYNFRSLCALFLFPFLFSQPSRPASAFSLSSPTFFCHLHVDALFETLTTRIDVQTPMDVFNVSTTMTHHYDSLYKLDGMFNPSSIPSLCKGAVKKSEEAMQILEGTVAVLEDEESNQRSRGQ